MLFKRQLHLKGIALACCAGCGELLATSNEPEDLSFFKIRSKAKPYW